MSAAPPEHVSAFELDALELGSLSAARAEEVRGHIGQCERCQQDHQQLQASADRFRRAVLPRILAEPTPSRSPWLVSKLRFFLLPTLALGAAMAIVGVRGRNQATNDVTDVIEPPGYGIKGGAALMVYARHEGRVSVLADGARLAAGDQLRLVAEPDGLPFLLVASVDGGGKASVYYPWQGERSGHLDAGRRIELPGSVVLDAAPGPERVFALFSREPIEAAEVLTALRKLGAGGAPEIRSQTRLPTKAAAQTSLLFEKPGP